MGTALPHPIRGPRLNARDYYLDLQRAIRAAPHVLRIDMQFEEIDVNECYVRGVLTLIGDFELHVAEYVITEPIVTRPKYRYHLQSTAGDLISRWDNAPHHPDISTFPDHRHDDRGSTHASNSMNIPEILVAILQFI